MKFIGLENNKKNIIMQIYNILTAEKIICLIFFSSIGKQ